MHSRDGRLGRRLGAQGRPHHRRRMAPGHDRPRCVYVDFLNTGPAVSKTLRTQLNRIERHPHGRRSLHCRSRAAATAKSAARSPASSAPARRSRIAAKATIAGDRRTDAALPAQQRVGQHGRRRLCAGVARRRRADRHGIRAVLSDRPSGAAADRHGPDHVGSVPLQARRQAAQRPHGGIHRRATAPTEDGKYVLTRDLATYAILKEVEAGRGSPHGGAYLSFQHCPEAELARGVRAGDRPAGGQRHRSHQDAGRGGADRALPHGRRARRRAHGNRACPACSSPAKRSAAPMAPTGSPATPSPRRWCSARAPAAAPRARAKARTAPAGPRRPRGRGARSRARPRQPARRAQHGGA